jgi:signal transduction histidine kinase
MRNTARASLDRQLRYEQALAGCSKNLLSAVSGTVEQYKVLNLALEQLRGGARTSRAYIFRNILEEGQVTYMGMHAEVCAPAIPPQIDNPNNQKFPWSELPVEMFRMLEANNSFGGPVRRAFTSTPGLVEIFLNQEQPLLSILCLPIFMDDRWWGFVGFDDCQIEREWDEQEILMLRTAAEMIGNTLQRWQAEDRLQNTLEQLEQRVQERTIEYAQANAELRYEINERQILQKELEERLEIEMIMASISARLLSSTELRIAIQETMADLGRVVLAKRVAFIRLDEDTEDKIEDIIEWHVADLMPLTNDEIRRMIYLYPEFLHQMNARQTVYVADLAELPEAFEIEKLQLSKREIRSLLLVPVFMDDHLVGSISFTNMELPRSKVLTNIRSVEVIAGMLASTLRRDEILNVLEEKVSERTRQLSAFFDMAMLAGEAKQLADFMQPALVKVMEVIACEAAAIHLFDDEQQILKLIAHYGIPNDYLAQIESFPVDGPVISRIKSDEIWDGLSNNLAALSEFNFPDFCYAAHTSLRAKGNIQGLLSCYRIADMPFTVYQQVFLNAIGEQLGLAVENYRLRIKAERSATIQERQRLARELHDAVSQSLYSLTLYARSGRDALAAGDQAKLYNSLEELEINSLVALKEMRLLLYQLRSLALEERGLAQAIESRFNLVERRSGIQANIIMDESVKLAENVEQELFLLITEALNNALKHAQADQVFVKLQKEDGLIVVEIQDNGSGFDPLQVTGGMGLLNMQDRAAALGGQIEITNQKDRGTRIRLEIPHGLAFEEGEGYYE